MQLSKLLLITVLTLICVVFSISQAVSKEKIFNTGTGGFMFVYPGNWIDITPQATDSNPQGPGIIAAVKAPIFVIGGANCNVVRAQDPAFKGLPMPQTKQELFDVLGPDLCKGTLPNWQDVVLDFEGSTFVDNIPAVLCKASGTSKSVLGTFRLKTIYVIFVKPPSAYEMGCYVQESEYDAMEPTFINILGSFGFN